MRALAVLLTTFLLAGCAKTTHLGGEYRRGPVRTMGVSHQGKRVLAEDERWVFLWGLLDDGDVNLHRQLKHQLRPNEYITDMDLGEHRSIPGIILEFVTFGIVTHNYIELEGRVVETPIE